MRLILKKNRWLSHFFRLHTVHWQSTHSFSLSLPVDSTVFGKTKNNKQIIATTTTTRERYNHSRLRGGGRDKKKTKQENHKRTNKRTNKMDSSYDSDDLPEGVDGLFDQSIFDNLNKELDDLRESFDLIDTTAKKGSMKDGDDDNDYDSDSDGDDSGSVEESAPSGISAVAAGGGTKKNNDDDDDDDDYDSDYHEYDEDDPDSGENKLFSMMDDLVMQLQMDLKEGDDNDDHHPSTTPRSKTDAVTTQTPDQLVNKSSSGNSATKPRSDSMGTAGSTGSGRKRAAAATPEDREKGLRLHMQVRSLLKRVTDMATHATDEEDDEDSDEEEHVGFHQTEEKEGDVGCAGATTGSAGTPIRRKRGDSSADQIERLLGAIENYSQSHTPSPSRSKAISSQNSTNNNASIESPASVNDPDDSVALVEKGPTEEEHAKTARAMSGLLQKKRREYLLRRKHEEDSPKKKEIKADRDHQDGKEDENNIDDAELVAEMRNASIREAVTVSAEEEQLRKEQQEEKLRQHRRSQEELLRRRVQLMRQQQLLQQKEQLLLQHQYMMQQGQLYQQQQQQQQALAARQQSVNTTATTNKNKKKKGKKKRTNKHRKGKRKVKPVGTGGGNYPGGYPMHHPQHNAVSRKTLQALYAKLLALDEQLSAEYGDCAQ